MRWKLFDYYQWHRVFTWLPVHIGDDSVWLEYVERRCKSVNEAGTNWEYRLPESMTPVMAKGHGQVTEIIR